MRGRGLVGEWGGCKVGAAWEMMREMAEEFGGGGAGRERRAGGGTGRERVGDGWGMSWGMAEEGRGGRGGRGQGGEGERAGNGREGPGGEQGGWDAAGDKIQTALNKAITSIKDTPRKRHLILCSPSVGAGTRKAKKYVIRGRKRLSSELC